jgi:fatty acid desaturase
MDLARTVAMMLLSIVLPLMVQLVDKRRMDEERRARTWNIASWAAALYAFGPFSMLGWIFVTRRRWVRCLIAPLWTLPVLGCLVLVDQILELELKGHIAQPIKANELFEFAWQAYLGLVVALLVIELKIFAWRALKRKVGAKRPVANGAG